MPGGVLGGGLGGEFGGVLGGAASAVEAAYSMAAERHRGREAKRAKNAKTAENGHRIVLCNPTHQKSCAHAKNPGIAYTQQEPWNWKQSRTQVAQGTLELRTHKSHKERWNCITWHTGEKQRERERRRY